MALAMVQIDIPIVFATGLLMAFAMREFLPVLPPERRRAWCLATALSMIAAFLPTTLFFLWEEPFWDTMYRIAPLEAHSGGRLPGIVAAAFCAGVMLAALGSVFLGAALLRRGQPWLTVLVAAALYLGCALLTVWEWPRFTFVGDYADFQSAIADNTLAANFAESRIPDFLAAAGAWGALCMAPWAISLVGAIRRARRPCGQAPGEPVTRRR